MEDAIKELIEEDNDSYIDNGSEDIHNSVTRETLLKFIKMINFAI